MLEHDKEEKIGHTRVQHGKSSDRIYVMDYKYALDPYLINRIQLLAKDFDYGKIIAKVPKVARAKFTRQDFEIEAKIPKFYNGKKPCLFMAKYNTKSRKNIDNKEEILDILEQLKGNDSSDLGELDSMYSIRVLVENDAEDMSRIYKKVFETYPFPIHDADYLKKTMSKETIYFGIFNQEDLVGISSCEMNSAEENVEMTDFAILPDNRGNQLASHLLNKMEQVMTDMGIKTAFTIARSTSLPMNATFSNRGYEYGGTLWNNTQIAGKIESMNVWYKPLPINDSNNRRKLNLRSNVQKFKE